MARTRSESGAVVPLVAVSMVLLIAVAAFTVDIGMQRVARRDMQALADVVALDLARLMGERTTAELDAMKASAIAASVARNPDTLGDPPAVDADFGELDANGDFVPGAADEIATAVEVTATTSVDFAFHPGSGGAARTAIAEADESACLKVGSVAAAVQAGDSSAIAILNGLLDQALGVDLLAGGLTAASYQGLANAKLTLLDLVGVDALQVGTVDELLADQAISVGDLNAAMITVLSNQDPPNTAAIQILEAIETGIGPIAAHPVNLGTVLGLEQGNESALAMSLNALDLITTAALIADGSNAVAVEDLGLSLGLSDVSGSLSLIDAPDFQCGRVGETTATSQEASVDLTGTLLSLPPVTIPLITELSTTAGSASVHLGLARSRADLTDISCKTAVAGSVDQLTADVTTGLLSTSVTVPLTITGKLGVTDALGLPALAKITIDLTAKVSTQQGSVNKPGQVLLLPPNDTSPKKTGAGVLGLSGLSAMVDDPAPSITVTLLGLPLTLTNALTTTLLQQVQTAVSSLLAPTLVTLDAALVGPLSDLLGLELAGADLYGAAAVCNDAALRG